MEIIGTVTSDVGEARICFSTQDLLRMINSCGRGESPHVKMLLERFITIIDKEDRGLSK